MLAPSTEYYGTPGRAIDFPWSEGGLHGLSGLPRAYLAVLSGEPDSVLGREEHFFTEEVKAANKKQKKDKEQQQEDEAPPKENEEEQKAEEEETKKEKDAEEEGKGDLEELEDAPGDVGDEL